MPILWVTAGALSQEPSASTSGGMLDARGRRRHTVLDLDYRPTFWRSREEASARIGAAVDHATIAVGNREECAVAVGTEDPREAAARLRAKGVELAIVKLGGDGVLLSSEQAERLIEPPADRGGVRARRRRRVRRRAVPRAAGRWPHERTIAFANAAGGIVASRLLCSQAMPYEHEVVELLEDPGMSAATEVRRHDRGRTRAGSASA